MILIIDNYDSFTYNLYQYVGELYNNVKVLRNDKFTIEELKKLPLKGIIVSPGPGRPENAGLSIEVIRAFEGKLPILGIC
jgi:anthranilate synthase component 2